MVVILAMGIGLFAPPFGVGYYAACAIGRVDPDEGIRPIWGYLLALMVGLIIVAIFPWISIGFSVERSSAWEHADERSARTSTASDWTRRRPTTCR